MTPAELRDRLRLARTEGVGPITYRKLMQRFPTAAAALDAVPELARAGGRASAPRIPGIAATERELERLHRLGARMLVLDGPDYPPLLALTEAAPPVFAVLGDPALLSRRAVALVGARNASANGQRVADLLASDLALKGLVVVSGMARGIDAAAHQGALRTGTTIAAIAGGLDVPYPPENAALQQEVAERGAVVAEAPLGTAPQARHFPRRNRIIAGLALGVVVVEAAPRSGSLITARLAQEAHRELFAVPGSPLDPRCRGSNDLIRAGAHLTETAADVLAHLPDLPGAVPPLSLRQHSVAEMPQTYDGSPPEGDAVRRRVLELLGPAPTPVDDLMRRCQFPASAVIAALLDLELAQRVEMLPGNHACLIGEGPPR